MKGNTALEAFGMKKNELNVMSSQNLSQEEDEEADNRNARLNEDGSKKESNTIMQQINNFSLTPMNDTLAEQTIEDHKYLLELVENKCAIAFFAAINRNQSLYNALQQYVITNGSPGEGEEEEE